MTTTGTVTPTAIGTALLLSPFAPFFCVAPPVGSTEVVLDDELTIVDDKMTMLEDVCRFNEVVVEEVELDEMVLGEVVFEELLL